MSKLSARRLKKKKARQKVTAKKLHIERERRRYKEKFPGIRVLNEDADPQFVRAVLKELNGIDLRDRSLFRPSETKLYRELKKKPVETWEGLQQFQKENYLAWHHFNLKLGQIVFNRIGNNELKRWLPYNDVQIIPSGSKFKVIFRSLHRQGSPDGTIYFSRHKPTILIDGQPKIVGFSQHSIEQICKRICPRWLTYAGLGDVFAFFDQCLHFEPSDLHDGQLAFSFYAECVSGFFNEQFVTEILGCQVTPHHHYHRVGYCPAVIAGDFVKAMTLLYPGFTKTPEYGAIVHSTLPFHQKKLMREQATQMDAEYLRTTGDFSLIKWFHDHGVPQVIESETLLYAPAV